MLTEELVMRIMNVDNEPCIVVVAFGKYVVMTHDVACDLVNRLAAKVLAIEKCNIEDLADFILTPEMELQ